MTSKLHPTFEPMGGDPFAVTPDTSQQISEHELYLHEKLAQAHASHSPWKTVAELTTQCAQATVKGNREVHKNQEL